jgi:hypothetical protein
MGGYFTVQDRCRPVSRTFGRSLMLCKGPCDADRPCLVVHPRHFRRRTGTFSQLRGGDNGKANTAAHVAVTRGSWCTASAVINFQALSSTYFHGYLKGATRREVTLVYTPSVPLRCLKGVDGPTKRANEHRSFDASVQLVIANVAYPPGWRDTTGRRVFCCTMQNGVGRVQRFTQWASPLLPGQRHRRGWANERAAKRRCARRKVGSVPSAFPKTRALNLGSSLCFAGSQCPQARRPRSPSGGQCSVQPSGMLLGAQYVSGLPLRLPEWRVSRVELLSGDLGVSFPEPLLRSTHRDLKARIQPNIWPSLRVP